MLYLMSVFHNYSMRPFIWNMYTVLGHLQSPQCLHICCSIRPYFKARGPSRLCSPFSPTCSTQNGGKAPHHRDVFNGDLIWGWEIFWSLALQKPYGHWWGELLYLRYPVNVGWDWSLGSWSGMVHHSLLMREAQLGPHLQPCEMKPIEFFLAPVDHLIWVHYSWYLISQIHLVIHPSIKLHLAICPRVPLPVCVAPTVAFSGLSEEWSREVATRDSHVQGAWGGWIITSSWN